jgi:DNA processing protein
VTDAPDSAAPLRLALALLDVPGVGRATVHRVLHHAASYDALLALPREQLGFRLKGVSKAAELADLLHDPTRFADHLGAADREIEARERQRVALIAPGHPHWPAGLDRISAAKRPVVLYAFGDAALLSRPTLGLLGAAGLDPAAFERAQQLAGEARQRGVGVLTAMDDGFDVATLKRAGGGIGVCGMGLSRIPPALRPAVMETVRGGGLIVSPFAMEHGPFPHDQSEATRVRLALSTAAVAIDPAPGTHLLRAVERHASGDERATSALFSVLVRAQADGAHPLDPDALWAALS